MFAALAALAVGFGASACDRSDAKDAAAIKRTTTTSSTTTSTSTTTTAPPIVAPAGLGMGSKGPQVQELETRLAAQKYDPGKVDGYFDSSTYHAVLAFQKVHGLKRTGRATDDVLNLIGTVGAPGPMLPAGGATRVEVDLQRQILQLYVGGALNRVVDVSTGSGKKYCVPGDGCATAVTPGGSYKVFFRRNGWRTSKLGKLYNPLYFNGGIAIHGEPAVPAYPASHGCVRIPMYVSYYFPSLVPNGTPVYVIGGAKAAVPFNEPAPNGETGTGGPATTTSTTAAPATTTTTTHSIFPTTTTSSTTTTTP
ncbi:MAG TPA: L,D-transpeptidase family protein [Acidimicrobiales bacterium]|nr:L,D-transpeptidase family protein [Acidimicrobiales bacterium]